MSVINTNVSATIASNAILRNDRAMGTAMERLSTGLRINSAKDDAAGLAISSRMKAAVSGLEMASKNANDAISMLEVGEGATLEISNMLIRMRELAVQSASGTYSDTDRDALDLEFTALLTEIDRVAKNTTWNTMSVLNGADSAGAAVYTAAAEKTTVNIQLGANASQTMAIEFNTWVPSVAVDMQATSASGTGSNGLDPQQTSTVTLKALSTGDTVTIGGKTYTAASDLTAAEVATNFVASLEGDGNAITGWTAQVDSNNSSAIRFTSTADESVETLVMSSSISADPTLAVTTQGVTAATGVTAETEVATLTFKPLATDDTVIIDGFTFTAASDLTAEAAAEAFLTAYSASGSSKSGNYAAARVGEVVTFTAASAGDETDLTVGGTRADQALAAAVTEDYRASESAFGDAILYWNNGGTATAINIDTVGNSEFAIDQLDKAILGVATERAKYGAFMSRLEHSSDNLLNVAQNTDQSRSRIEDADYAVETSELARTQIISQASTAMLAQANQSKQSVLSLLQG